MAASSSCFLSCSHVATCCQDDTLAQMRSVSRKWARKASASERSMARLYLRSAKGQKGVPATRKMSSDAAWSTAALETWKDADWAAAFAGGSSADAESCKRYLLQIAAQTSEFYLGGNDTPFLLQLLSAPCEKGEDVDLVVTVLAPNEGGEVKYCHTARTEAALTVCASFMNAFPNAPVLMQKADGGFDYVLCSVLDEEWTKGPVTLQRLLDLQRRTSEEDRVAFYLPAEASARPTASFDRFPLRPDVVLD